MNEFEALQILRAKGVIDTRYCKKIELDECLDVIEKALLELQAIKEAKPSEALECLERIKECWYDDPYTDRADNVNYETDITTIKQALLKQLSGSQYYNIFIDEAVKPSEAMKCLNDMERDLYVGDYYKNNIAFIKQYILKAQKLEQAWEILKPLCEVVETPVRKDRYLKINGVVVYTFKSKEEFDLLKEMLE